MRLADAAGAHELATEAFADLAQRLGDPTRWPSPGAADHRRGLVRMEHLLETDPDGCWVAEDDGKLIGVANAIEREGLWGLSLLIVAPGRQGEGLGSALMERALAYAGGGERAAMILSSDDPAAIRVYRRAGFELRPAMYASGEPPLDVPDGEAVREGTTADIPMCQEVGREVRGASHGGDLEALMRADCELLIC
jgi:GNAT superfamily N-acetyltransferase